MMRVKKDKTLKELRVSKKDFKYLVGLICFSFGPHVAVEEGMKEIKNTLKQKNKNKIFIDSEEYTEESLYSLLKFWAEEAVVYYRKKQEDSDSAVKEIISNYKNNVNNLPEITAKYSACQGIEFFNNGIEFIQGLFYKQNYNVKLVRTLDVPKDNMFFLDNGEPFRLSSIAKIDKDTDFSYQYLDFYMEKVEDENGNK